MHLDSLGPSVPFALEMVMEDGEGASGGLTVAAGGVGGSDPASEVLQSP